MIKLNKEIKLKQLGCIIGQINMILILKKQIRKYKSLNIYYKW